MSQPSTSSHNLQLVRAEILRACAVLASLILLVQAPWLRAVVHLLLPSVPFITAGALLCLLAFEWIGTRMSEVSHRRLLAVFTLLLGVALALFGVGRPAQQILATICAGAIGVAAWHVAPLLRINLSGPNSPVASVTTLVRISLAMLWWLPPLPRAVGGLVSFVFVAIWSAVLLRDTQDAQHLARQRIMTLNSWELTEITRRVLFALAVVQLSLRDALEKAF